MNFPKDIYIYIYTYIYIYIHIYTYIYIYIYIYTPMDYIPTSTGRSVSVGFGGPVPSWAFFLDKMHREKWRFRPGKFIIEDVH